MKEITPYKNIVICGDIGTGTSTVAKSLAKDYGWEFLSAGDWFKKWHKDNNVPLENAHTVPDEVHQKIDSDARRMLTESSHIIYESRLGGWLMKDEMSVLKILITADTEERIKRIMHRENLSLDQAKAHIDERSRNAALAFKKLYAVDNCLDPKLFNLIINNTNMTKQQTLHFVQGLIENLTGNRH